MTYTPEQQAFINARILQAKRELLRSWWGMDLIESRSGMALPTTVRSFSELHDYCDANELGGLCDDDINIEADRLFGTTQAMRDAGDMNEAWIDASNEVQNAIHQWLASRQSVADFAFIVTLLLAEQVDCMLDDERTLEAAEMLIDLHGRVGAAYGFTDEACKRLADLTVTATQYGPVVEG